MERQPAAAPPHRSTCQSLSMHTQTQWAPLLLHTAHTTTDGCTNLSLSSNYKETEAKPKPAAPPPAPPPASPRGWQDESKSINSTNSHMFIGAAPMLDFDPELIYTCGRFTAELNLPVYMSPAYLLSGNQWEKRDHSPVGQLNRRNPTASVSLAYLNSNSYLLKLLILKHLTFLDVYFPLVYKLVLSQWTRHDPYWYLKSSGWSETTNALMKSQTFH